MDTLFQQIQNLPPDLQHEVADFVEFLLKKAPLRKKTKLKLSWAGSLKHLRSQFTSLELQKKITGLV